MLVESLDGSRALLGRSKRMRPGMLTCLSGFIEQVLLICEPVALMLVLSDPSIDPLYFRLMTHCFSYCIYSFCEPSVLCTETLFRTPSPEG